MVTVFLVLVLQPGAAMAAILPSPRGPVDAGLYAKATNGYTAQLKSEGDKLQLTLSRGLLPSLIYIFHGRVSTAGIQAKIADLGTIDLRFKPSGKSKRVDPPRNCSGPRATLVEGHFVGEFDFRAERGVAKIDLVSAKGSLAAPGWHCHKQSIGDFLRRAPGEMTYTFLQAIAPGLPVGLTAFSGVDAEHPEAHGAEISASERTHRGAVTVDHLAITLAVNAFSFDSALTSATVTPPKPFQGSASYCAACSPGTQWTGDLSVSLPGLARPVALTGSSFRATLMSIQGTGPKSEPSGSGSSGTFHRGTIHFSTIHGPSDSKELPTPVLTAGASASPSAGLPSPQELPPGAVAVVVQPPAETQTITVHDFKRAMSQATAQAGLKRTPSPGQNGYRKLKVSAMKSLLDESWIPVQAAEMGIAVTPRQIATELAQIKKQNFRTGAEYRKFLKMSHYTRSDVAELIKLQMLSTAIQHASSQASRSRDVIR